MNQARADRVAQALQRELGAMLLTDVKDPRIGFVSVTRVEVSRDLRVAKIHVSVLGDQEQMESSLSGLKSAASYLRGELARRLGLRLAPQLDFRPDRSIDDSLHLQEILKTLPEVPNE